jgi:hypothetical protein
MELERDVKDKGVNQKSPTPYEGTFEDLLSSIFSPPKSILLNFNSSSNIGPQTDIGLKICLRTSI